MAMNYLWGDMYPQTSVMNTAQKTIPEESDKQALPHDATNGNAGIKDSGKSSAGTKEIFIFMLVALVVAFILGSM